MVPLTVFYIVGSGILAKRPVFDDFLDGAKEGMRTVADVLPTLIGPVSYTHLTLPTNSLV